MSEPAVTIAEAASRLGVSRQRVSQLLGDGRLVGPDYGPGRAPSNAERVLASSLASYASSRGSRPGLTRRQQLEDRVGQLEALVDELRLGVAHPLGTVELAPDRGAGSSAVEALIRQTEARERAARQAALELKVTLDALQERLEQQLSRNSDISRRAAELELQLETANGRADLLEAANRGLSGSLGVILGPDDPQDLG